MWPLRTPSRVSRSLLILQIEGRIQTPVPAHLYKGDLYTLQSILTFIKRLIRICFQALNQRFLDWTKPASTSLLWGTLIALGRRKSELVAENALLRQQLIILNRQVKRPTCAPRDRMLLVFLARMVRTWKQAHITRSARDAPAVASSRISAVLEVQVQGSFCQTKDLPRDRGLDQGDGKGQSTVGSGTDPRRMTQARSTRQPAARSRSI